MTNRVGWGARAWIALVARVALGAAFVWLGRAKALDPVAFMKSVREYDALPDPALTYVAVLLPWVEIVLGVCLVLGVAVRGAALAALVSLVVFTAAVAARALDVHAAQGGAFCAIAFDCGCGTGVERICRKLPENAALIVAAALALAWRSRLALRARPLERS